jgi:hypothetical protein
MLALGVIACASPRPEVATGEPQSPAASETKAKPVPPPSIDAGGAQKTFSLGCEPDASGPPSKRIELSRTPPEARWLWACRAVALLGSPKLRESGHPDFRVNDSVSGACMTLSLEDAGAFIHHAPVDRGEALRAALEAQPNVPDCSFEIGVDGSGARPLKVGLRAGHPFEEPLYDLDGFEGARAFFTAHPNEHSAAGFLSRYLALPPASRPNDVTTILESALDLELAAFAKMETAWLSAVGKKGYCLRSKDLVKLPVSKAHAQRVAGEVKRFCKP